MEDYKNYKAAQWTKAIRAGDEAALSYLFGANSALYVGARQLLLRKGVPSLWVDDIIQAAAMCLIQAVGKYGLKEDKPDALFFKIIRTRRIDYYRKAERENRNDELQRTLFSKAEHDEQLKEKINEVYEQAKSILTEAELLIFRWRLERPEKGKTKEMREELDECLHKDLSKLTPPVCLSMGRIRNLAKGIEDKVVNWFRKRKK